jgi:hypothetical protein
MSTFFNPGARFRRMNRFSAKSAESMAYRGIVKLRRGLLLWPLVGPTRATARRASVSSTEVAGKRLYSSVTLCTFVISDP